MLIQSNDNDNKKKNRERSFLYTKREKEVVTLQKISKNEWKMNALEVRGARNTVFISLVVVKFLDAKKAK